MQGKLYVFGIGGTGSRVLKSLVMLAAAGVNIEASSIVPIIIDPDFANADLTRTVSQFRRYSTVQKAIQSEDISSSPNGFFKMPIEDCLEGFFFHLNDTRDKKFKDFIQYPLLNKQNQSLVSMLFSEENLKAEMEVGFKGNPNMGSVVLNQFDSSDDFSRFANAFKPGDRIFIISSIFGGTGASGFPLLVKNLRGISSAAPNHHAIKKAPIGAITVMPYFSVKKDGSSVIDSSTFIGKTKAALHYYNNCMTGARSAVNAMYYIGDSAAKQYENFEGGAQQKNNAHLIELLSALAIVDFASIPDCTDDQPTAMMTSTGVDGRIFAPNPVFKEYGLKKDALSVIFNDLYNQTGDLVKAPLSQFLLFSKYLLSHLSEAVSKPQPWAHDHSIDKPFIEAPFMADMKEMARNFITWLKEMTDNERGFAPFLINSDHGRDLFDMVQGIKANKVYGHLLKYGYDLFDSYLNSEQKKLPKSSSREKKVVDLFYNVTKELVHKKYNF